MNICKRCKKPFEAHVISTWNMQNFWCLRENEIMEPIQAGYGYIPMDNLDYVEALKMIKEINKNA